MKSNTEKFAGGDYTYTLETFSEVNGRSIQACTSHVLGQNFVHQTSWGFSTRSIGAFIMVHSDNKGLNLTPACADIQVTIVPIYFKNFTQQINEKVEEIYQNLKAAGIRVDVDDRENYSPGFRYNC
jgi:prolyl-tRNA synthetase